jgi:hypothetical protein
VPKHVGQLPVYYYRKYAKAHTDMDAEPLYPFGFGLPYTTFKVAKLSVQPASIRANESAQVAVQVTNTGKVAGDEVVQLYIRDDVASVALPPKRLKGFQRVHLEPGETRQVAFKVGYDESLLRRARPEVGRRAGYLHPHGGRGLEEAGVAGQTDCDGKLRFRHTYENASGGTIRGLGHAVGTACCRAAPRHSRRRL